MKYVMAEAVAAEGMTLLDGKEVIYMVHDANPANYREEMTDADQYGHHVYYEKRRMEPNGAQKLCIPVRPDRHSALSGFLHLACP